MIIWAMALTSLLGFLAVAVAAGDFVQSNTNAQDAADAAALLAASDVMTVSEANATGAAQALAESYPQVPQDSQVPNPWLQCHTPPGFMPADATTDNCIAFATDTLAQTQVLAATPALQVAAPNTGYSGEQVPSQDVVATLSGAADPVVGTIYFYVYGPSSSPTSPPSSCITDQTKLTGLWSSAGNVAVSGNGSWFMPLGYDFGAQGYYWWEAYYDSKPSTDNNSAASTCVTALTSVEPGPAAGDALSFTAPDSSPVGTAIGEGQNVLTQLSGTANTDAGDTVRFYWSGPSTTAPSCYIDLTDPTAVWTALGKPVGVLGDGFYYASGSFTPTQPGQYWWDAVFGGDANNGIADSSCTTPEETVVGPASPTLSLSVPYSSATNRPLPSSSGGKGDVIADLNGTALGAAGDTITFYESGPSATPPVCNGTDTQDSGSWNEVGTATVGADGDYSPNGAFTPTVPGDYWWDAIFNGDPDNQLTHSSCTYPSETVVSPAAIGLSLSISSPNVSTVGAAIGTGDVAADLTGVSNDATGTISFFVGKPGTSATSCPSLTKANSDWAPLGPVSVAGPGVYSPTAVSAPLTVVGSYAWYAVYSLDGTNGVTDTGCGVVAWVGVPGQSLPTILGSGISQGVNGAYAVYSQDTDKAKLCYYPGNCSDA